MLTTAPLQTASKNNHGTFLKSLLIIAIAGMITLGAVSPTRAAYSQTITVIQRLVVWASPSFNSPITAMLLTGEHFTVTARSESGSWIYGFTDTGMPGWISSSGFLQLHPEVILSALSVMAANSTTPMATSQTITVIRRLVVWASPSFSSPIIAVLLVGRHFTVTARSVSSNWIYGLTDMGMPGWISSSGFLQLHPEVNLNALPVMAAASSMMPTMMPMPTQVPMNPGSMGRSY